MKHAVLRLITESFITWLSKKLPPSGQPFLHDLKARLVVLIDALPDDGSLRVTITNQLDENSVKIALDWLFISVVSAYTGDSWAGIAAHSLRILALQAASEIPTMLAAQKDTSNV